MNSLTISDNLGSFKSLHDQNVINFFTYSNQDWGDMKRLTPGAQAKYDAIFKRFGVSPERMLAMGAEHGDTIRFIDNENYEVFWGVNPEKDTRIMRLWSDGFITKERIPIIVSPGDCCVVAITGVDREDGKRFIIVVHAGFTGAILKIVTKAVNLAHHYFLFANDSLTAYSFPHVSREHYVKPANDPRVQRAIKKPEWTQYLHQKDDNIVVAFGEKVESELRDLGIRYESSQIDTFDANRNGLLQSESYQKSINGDRSLRFGIGFCIT
jgi:copper oxidase (laccase) domain-containing protein